MFLILKVWSHLHISLHISGAIDEQNYKITSVEILWLLQNSAEFSIEAKLKFSSALPSA